MANQAETPKTLRSQNQAPAVLQWITDNDFRGVETPEDSKLTTSNLQLTRFLANKVAASEDKIDSNSKYESNEQEGEDGQVVHSTAHVFVNKIANGLKIVPYRMSDIVKGSGGLTTTLKADAQKQLLMHISSFAKVIYPPPFPEASNASIHHVVTTSNSVIAQAIQRSEVEGTITNKGKELDLKSQKAF